MQTPNDDAAAPYSHIFPIGYSYYAIATSLTPAFYQKLVNRCWRRSGTLLYRPNQKHSCCPHYTLRLDSTKFRPTKDQRQAVNRFNKHVVGEAYNKEAAHLRPRSREEVRKRDNEFDLISRIHEAELESLEIPPRPAHEFTITLEPDTFTDEKYEVFENYQRLVHKEPPEKISQNGFKRFLCGSPLTRGSIAGPDDTKRQLGSFHQCYRLDGKLIAIGVLDLLPDCVSAVYFLYHESVHPHNLGKLGAIREITLALEAGYRWWYSGFYIHSCPKMKYKVDYSPQYVLDPETLEWDLLDKEALAIFDKKPYVSLSREMRSNVAYGVSKEDDKVLDGATQANKAERVEEEEGFLFNSDMPGIPSLEQMEQVVMDNLLLRSDYSDSFFLASDLVVWDTESITERGNLKSRIAELVAAIGPDLMSEFCVDFRKRDRM
ncbi:arginine-tRNA-protein transferase [Lasiosphaeris hirsuta]|uniref:arginyltransferase n=1 Tax=Lasiosphaeris hirsuta TaxID=260670 RepID=A0AA40DLL8_9PEZI|nr:arginine-tRNA-protein transferase [Lasiosphaeris hirsuta]